MAILVWPWRRGPRPNPTTPKDSQPMISYRVGLPSQTSTTNNKRVISSLKFGYPRLTLKEGPKVKSNHTRRFPAHDFLYVGLPSQTSRTNNKRVISTLSLAILAWLWRRGPRSNLTTSEDLQHMISYWLVSHCKPLGPIIREKKALLKSAVWVTSALCGWPWITTFKVKCMQGCRGHVYLLYISPMKRFNLLPMRNSQ